VTNSSLGARNCFFGIKKLIWGKIKNPLILSILVFGAVFLQFKPQMSYFSFLRFTLGKRFFRSAYTSLSPGMSCKDHIDEHISSIPFTKERGCTGFPGTYKSMV
jgi:hypothetical protein